MSEPEFNWDVSGEAFITKEDKLMALTGGSPFALCHQQEAPD